MDSTVVWKDKGVTTLSIAYAGRSTGTIKSTEVQEVMIPLSTAKLYMGGVDKLDQFIS